MNTEEKKIKWNSTLMKTHLAGFFVIAFFIAVVVLFYRMVYTERTNSIIKDGKISASKSADEFDKYLSTNTDIVNIAAYTLDEMLAENRSEKEIQDYLVAQSTAVRKSVNENMTGLYGYINGRFYSGTNWVPPEDYDATARPWYQKPMGNKGKITILEPYVDVQSGNTMLAIGKTLSDKQSVISVDVSLDKMQTLTEEIVRFENADIEMVIDGDGTVVTHSDINEVGKEYSKEDGSLGALIFSTIMETGNDFFDIEYEGTKYIVYCAPFLDDWRCISVKNSSQELGSLNRLVFITIAIIVLIIIMISAIMMGIIKRSIITDKAVAQNEAKSLFLSNMSHELRTPINVVLGFNEMIIRESREPAILSHSENIKSAGMKLLEFVDELLAVSENKEDYEKVLSEKDNKESVEKTFLAPTAHILVVDDNPMNLIVFKNLTKRNEVWIDTADGGEDAVLVAKRNKYDIIFLDHMMPGKDGIEALHDIRENDECINQKTPIICLTANAISGARERYIAEGFDDYINKPIDPDALEDLIIKFLPSEKVRFVEKEKRKTEALDKIVIPDDLLPLTEYTFFDVERGIRNNGGSPESYKTLLQVFHDSMDDISYELEGYFHESDWKSYTVRVHALKSSARIIGAPGLAEEASRLEEAGKRNDIDYIKQHHESFIREYRQFAIPLEKIFPKEDIAEDKPVADEDIIKEFYEELYAAAEDMDCDRMENVFEFTKDYSFPEEYRDDYAKLKDAASKFLYDKVTDIIDARRNA